MTNGNVRVSGLRRVDLARRTGCHLETIRYYENVGVMPEPARTESGHRRYDATHVTRLGFIMRARDLGFTLEEIRSLLDLVDGGVQTCAEVRAVANGHMQNVQEKIADLRRIERVLSATIAECSGKDVPDCAVIDALMPDTD